MVPYTIDARDDIAAAVTAGVDELITNDPLLARRTEGELEGKPAPIPPPPSKDACIAARAHRSLGTIEARGSRRHGLRVFPMQLKQEARHVVTYASFRTKIECMIRERVLPRLAHGAPNVVAFNEDVGLITLGTGSRGAEARAIVEDPASVCGTQGFPCAAAVVGRRQVELLERGTHGAVEDDDALTGCLDEIALYGQGPSHATEP